MFDFALLAPLRRSSARLTLPLVTVPLVTVPLVTVPLVTVPLVTVPLVRLALVSLALVSGTLAGRSLQAQPEWNRFRGENGSGVVEQCQAPLPWKATDIAWSVKLPGQGNGSPIIQGDAVYVLSADPDTAERYVLSHDLATGKERWRAGFPSSPHPLHPRSSYASSTPCADESAVYVAWGAPDGVVLTAFAHSGAQLWSRTLERYLSQYGFGNSPILADGKLILLNSQDAQELPAGVEPGQSRITAFNPESGVTIWETPLRTTRVCYGVPVVAADDTGRELLLLNETGEGICALDPKTGQRVWNRQTFTKRCVSSPVVINGLTIGTEGAGAGGNVLFAVDMGRQHELVFQLRKAAPYVPTPVGLGNLMFTWDDKGIVSCVSLPEGQVHWSERIGGNVSASPVIAGDKLIGVSEEGRVTILAADKQFKNYGQVALGETTRATPALHPQCVVFRSDSTLTRVGR